MRKIVGMVCFLVVVSVVFNGCRVGLYMEDFENVQWTCDVLELQFSYTSDNPEAAIGNISKDDENIEILCKFFSTKVIWIYDKLEYDALASDEACDPLLTGSYSIEGDVATVKITTDNLFNGEYLDKEIHLTKTPIE